jgi:phenylacetic acid degradation protein
MHIPTGKNVSGNPAVVTHDVTDNQKIMAKAGIDYYRELCKKYIATMKVVI